VITSTNPTGGASTWTIAKVDTAAIEDISCPSVSLCVAVDNIGNVLTSTNPTGGSSVWTSADIDGSLNKLVSVSCPSASLCVATDFWGNVVTSTNPTGGASTWTIATVDTSVLEDISCPSVSLCVAIEGQGNVVTSTNPLGGASAWTTADVDGTNTFTGISCPSTSLCAAVDYKGFVLTSTNPTGGASTWTAANVKPPPVVPTVTKVSPDSGPTTGGTPITITGTGFLAGATVAVGQGSGSVAGVIHATSVKVVSPTEITAVTGSGAGAGIWALFVTTSGGTSAGNTASDFHYKAAPGEVPTISRVTPNAGPTTGGTPITIIGTGFVAGATVVVGQGSGSVTGVIPATDVKVVRSTEITAVTGSGTKAGTWALFVHTSGGTSAGNPASFFTYTVAPTVSKVSPNSGPTTGGTPITITGTGFVTGATVVVGQGSGSFTGAIHATSVKVVSYTEITAVTGGGAKAGTWSVFVHTTGGTSAGGAAADFTYH
jgi:hypothetical protein